MTAAPTDPRAPPDLQALSTLAPELASTFVSVSADIALVIDADGVIKHVAHGAEPIVGSTGQWLGRPWADTVTGSTRRKIELLLSEVLASGVTRRREVNHPSQEASDIPVAYSAIRLGRDGPVLAVGRDLRAVAAIQQRFVEATQTMERDYWSQRQAESHVRMLYQLATDAVLVVDAHSLKIVDCNQAARDLLAADAGAAAEGHSSLVGADAAASVLPVERPGFLELLATARASGRPGVMRAHAAPAPTAAALKSLVPIEVSALPLRSGPTMQLLVHLRCIEVETDPALASRRRTTWVDGQPDALVITDSSGRVLMCNPSFHDLCRVPHGASAQRRTLAELLGDDSFTVSKVLHEARRQGLAHVPQALLMATAAAGAEATSDPGQHPVGAARPMAIELTATLLAEGDQECVGLRLRRLQPPPTETAAAGAAAPLALAIGQLAEQLGLVPMPQLLQQAAAATERHLIKAALERCQGRLPEAGALLGIPVSELQLRMQHLGVKGPGPDTGNSTQDTAPPAGPP